MPLSLHWVGEDQLDRIAETRLFSYAHASADLPRFQEHIRADRRAKPGDFLLAERDGRPVGTATSMPLTMWIRGQAFSCQGVAFVGALKTQRRRAADHPRHPKPSRPDVPYLSLAHPAASPRSPGVASALMTELLRVARERRHILTALNPFRATFYQRYGYGLVERKAEWTIPLPILPAGDFSGLRFFTPEDRPALLACRQRIVEQSQCDIERPDDAWDPYFSRADAGMLVVDRPDDSGPIHGWALMHHQPEPGRDMLRLGDFQYDSPEALLRLLCFLSSLRDQYHSAILTLPFDVPLNQLFAEPQLPHRIVPHATAQVRYYTMLQVRILDHLRFLEGLRIPPHHRGQATIAVRESEGSVSRFAMDVADGRIAAISSEASPDIECTDAVWAAIACGDLPPTVAARLGLIHVNTDAALTALRSFADGPLPFCRDFF